uniref:Protein Wnt n=1 Tax=Salarias fasciatus TaxID=181472 RepID=A0A672H8U9_SALFA
MSSRATEGNASCGGKLKTWRILAVFHPGDVDGPEFRGAFGFFFFFFGNSSGLLFAFAKEKALSHTPASIYVNQTQHCKMLPGMVSSQTIIQAAGRSRKTCQKTFGDMRWNYLDRGTREAAFVYALSAATISHTIARACTTGDPAPLLVRSNPRRDPRARLPAGAAAPTTCTTG